MSDELWPVFYIIVGSLLTIFSGWVENNRKSKSLLGERRLDRKILAREKRLAEAERLSKVIIGDYAQMASNMNRIMNAREIIEFESVRQREAREKQFMRN